MQKKILKDEISIQALTSKVWIVLTHPEYTSQYLFEGKVISEWQKGNPIILEVEKEGKKELLNQGTILEMVPGIFLRFTLPDPSTSSSQAMILSYELIPEEGGIRLK